MWTKDFWKATSERMIRGFASGMLSTLVVGDALLNAFNASWQEAAGVGVGSAVVALLLSLVGNAATGTGPSLTNSETTT